MLCACVTTFQCGNPGIVGSPCSPRSALFAHDLVHHCLIVMDYNGLLRSITKSFVSHIESYAFMTRTCLATILHIVCVCFNNESVPFQRWDPYCLQMKVCVGFTRFHNGLPRSIRRNSFFVKRIYIDLLGTGRFSSILHGSRVSSNNGLLRSIGSNNGLPRSIKTWVWNWLVRLETSRWLHNLSFWSLSMV